MPWLPLPAFAVSFPSPGRAADAGQLAAPGDVESTRAGLARRHVPATG